jgi:hypothetical protein
MPAALSRSKNLSVSKVTAVMSAPVVKETSIDHRPGTSRRNGGSSRESGGLCVAAHAIGFVMIAAYRGSDDRWSFILDLMTMVVGCRYVKYGA